MSSPSTCPNCKANLQGGLIYDTFLDQYRDHDKALETAKMYGATQHEGRWGLAIGISDLFKDRVVAWECPKCHHRWDR